MGRGLKMDADRVLVHYNWAEPGDPPNPDYASARSAPLAKRVSHPSVTAEIERQLIRAYHEVGDLVALDWLVEVTILVIRTDGDLDALDWLVEASSPDGGPHGQAQIPAQWDFTEGPG